jgi:hypothetical protein
MKDMRWVMPIHYDTLPEHCRESVKNYIERHQPVGSFLQFVIANDLRGAICRADEINSQHLKDYVMFFYNHAPSQCHGSREAYKEWIKKSERIKYKDFTIRYNPKPIPDRRNDWDWEHQDYDGPGDSRCGTAATAQAAMNDIDELEDV